MNLFHKKDRELGIYQGARIYNDLGILYMRKKDFDQAVYFFENASDVESTNFIISSNLAEAYLRSKALEQAENQYSTILDLAPCHVESNMGLGEVYIRRAEKDSDFYEQSIHHLTEALEISRAKKGSKFLSKKEEAEVLYLRGYARTKLFESSRSLLSISSLGKASNDFKESLELAPKHSPIYYSAKRSWQKVVIDFLKGDKGTQRHTAQDFETIEGTKK